MFTSVSSEEIKNPHKTAYLLHDLFSGRRDSFSGEINGMTFDMQYFLFSNIVGFRCHNLSNPCFQGKDI